MSLPAYGFAGDAVTAKPVEINYNRQTRVLKVSFDNGEQFSMSSEYLRVYSPSAEVRGHGPGQEVLQVGKEQVAIAAVEPVGNYAVRLCFDDGHDSGIYAFDELYRLGSQQSELWQLYLTALQRAGVERSPS